MKSNIKKKIAIIGTAGVPARYGGFETLAQNLVVHLNERYDLHVYASTKMYGKAERVKTWEGARIHYLPLGANGASSILYDIISMIHAWFYADYVLILGVSGGIFVPFLRLFSKTKIIVNIDGLEWRRNKWGRLTKRFLRFSEKIAVRYSHADITDNAAIKRYTALHYKTASHMIAYGADHAAPQKITKQDTKKYPFLNGPYAFKVARIEPENNIHVVLSAFSNLPEKNLVLVGNWNNSNYGKDLRTKYADCQNIYMLDPIYNQMELDKLRSNCFVYLHGHSAGGTNPSLVEAMYLKLPVLAFDVSYNRATMKGEGLFFNSEKELIKLLKKTSYKQLRKMGAALEEIAQFHYTWKNISERYAAIIESFNYAYSKPQLNRKTTEMSYSRLLEMGYAHLNHTKFSFDLIPKDKNHGK